MGFDLHTILIDNCSVLVWTSRAMLALIEDGIEDVSRTSTGLDWPSRGMLGTGMP